MALGECSALRQQHAIIRVELHDGRGVLCRDRCNPLLAKLADNLLFRGRVRCLRHRPTGCGDRCSDNNDNEGNDHPAHGQPSVPARDEA